MQRFTPAQILVLVAIALLFFSQMRGSPLQNPVGFAVLVAALVVAVTVHEFNHAFIAHVLGDLTPKLMGRLTLNPLSHLDVMGSLLFLIAQFGWGKPVPFNPNNLRINPALGSAAVSFAGPFANILLAIVLTLPLRLGLELEPAELRILDVFIRTNILLAAFNLVPIPPLDGFGVLHGLLPSSMGQVLNPLRDYGPIILLALVFLPSLGGPNVIGIILAPIVRVITVVVFGG
jgi:Zn-dependent protease